MVISDELSWTWDEECVTLVRGDWEGRTYLNPMGQVWTESDGQTWQVDPKHVAHLVDSNLAKKYLENLGE